MLHSNNAAEQLSAPKYICTCIVIKDFFPETNDYLTLELVSCCMITNSFLGQHRVCVF